MKTIKYILWLIILGLLGLLIYENRDYFLTVQSLTLDFKLGSLRWELPGLQNIAYMGITFFAGLIIAGIKGIAAGLRMKKEIKNNNATIDSLNSRIDSLKTDLEVFTHDPYIKRELEKKTDEAGSEKESENNTEPADNPGSVN
jgi:hypothetical protein